MSEDDIRMIFLPWWLQKMASQLFQAQKRCHKNKELKNRADWETTTTQSTPSVVPQTKACFQWTPAEQAAG